MKHKFFLISQVFYPDEVSTAGLMTDLCKVVVENGINSEVWCSQPSYSKEKRRQQGRVNYKGIDIHYLPSTNFYKGNIIGRIINVITFTTSVSLRILFSKGKDPVFTHTTPPILGIVISILCRFKRRKLHYILLDIFPEGLIRLGKMSASNPIVRIWQYLFRVSLKWSSKIIVIGRDMEKWIIGFCPECADNVLYIPLWQEESRIFPENFSDNQLAKDYNLESKFIVQYSGNMGLWNDMATLGMTAVRMPDVTFMFVGGGVRKKELFRFINEECKNIIYLPFQPSGNLSNLLGCCHLSIVSLNKGLEGMAVPSKIYGILASGKPVIALVPEESEIAFITREENCGIVVVPGDTDGLVKAITTLKADDELRRKMGENSRRAFNNRYKISIAAHKYISILEEQEKL